VRLRISRNEAAAAEPPATAEVRAVVGEVAAASGLSDDDRFGLQLAATEALANALRHGAGEAVEVSVEVAEDAIEVEVADRGVFRPEPSLESEGGRGLPLMVALVDEVQFARTDEGTRVRMRKRLPGLDPCAAL
jgi:serine/threonine-protein kinase RsbW